MRSLVVLNGGGWIGVDLLPEPLKGGIATPSEPVHAPGAVLPLWLIEKRAIEQTIAICGGNVLKAAELLRISPSTIYRKRQAWQGGAGALGAGVRSYASWSRRALASFRSAVAKPSVNQP